MTFEKFVLLVEQMRDAQVAYFQTRDKTVLSRSKSLERQVDKAIKESKSPQQTLL